MRLKPFFGYFGSKWRLAPKYPKPLYDTIIEPFAGSASYSLLHHQGRKVTLCDLNEDIAGIWKYLIDASPEEIMKLPDELTEDLTPAERALIGFWFAKASATPRKTKSPWATKHPDSSWWGLKIRQRIAQQLPFISKWEIRKGDYRSLENVEATWFIDPPYQHHGAMYPNGNRNFDYVELAEWCRGRRGQVIVCEGGGADWLPFSTLKEGKRTTGPQIKKVGPCEVVWLSESDAFGWRSEVG
jgi:site-specific DNA-adenine methylase